MVDMAFISRFALRRIASIVVVAIISYLSYAFFADIFIRSGWPAFKFSGPAQSATPSSSTLTEVHLTSDQCKAVFPELTKEIDAAVSRGPFKLVKRPDNRAGNVKGKIKNGKVCAFAGISLAKTWKIV